MMDGLDICFGVSVRVEKRYILKKTRTTRERVRKLTDCLKVSNNSVENIVSQGRFECFAYTTRKVNNLV